MSATKWMSALAFAAVAVGVSATGFAADFEPFTKVENICPDCKKTKADVLSLSDGTSVRGTVVAENDEFYTVVRYGEVRAVPRSSVQSIDWADGSRPSSLRDKDQIVLNNGHVFSGTIVEETDEPAFFRIKSSFSDYTYTVAKTEVKKAFKGGTEYKGD